MARHGMSDRGWGLIEQLLPEPEPRRKGRRWQPHRRVLDGIFWRLRTGAPWRDVPEEFGPWQTLYGRFRRWCRDGTFARILDRILKLVEEKGKIGFDLWCVDGTVVRAARCAAGAPKKARSPVSPKTML